MYLCETLRDLCGLSFSPESMFKRLEAEAAEHQAHLASKGPA